MATVSQIITQRLGRYSIELDQVDIDGILTDAGLDGSTQYADVHIQPVRQIILSEISRLLAMPDVTEGGYSVKWDRASVKAYCAQLRDELGLTAVSAAVVQDRSYLW